MESSTSTLENPTALDSKNPIILIVDDDQDILNYVGSTLRRHGYTVYSAHCASFAMAAFRRHPEIQLLLTDIKMPDLEGTELAERLKSLKPELTVVYMSGELRPELAGVLRKPFTPAQLLAAVSQEIARSAA